MKYGVVGRHVNLTARIQSYTIGGQILISDTTRREAGATLKLGKQTAIKAKGIEHPVTVCEVLGIGGRHRLFLAETANEMVSLPQPINVVAAVVEGSHLSGDTVKGRLTKLSLKQAEAELEHAVPPLANLKIDVLDGEGSKIQGAVYGKVLGPGNGANATTLIRFTSLSPEIEAFLRGVLGGPEPARSASESPRTVATPPQAAPVPKAPESRPAGQQAPTPEAQLAPAVAKTVAPAALDGGQSPPAAALSGSGTAGPAASPPRPANAAPVMPAHIEPPPPAGEKQPSPHNGADTRGVNITALMSSTKPAEPEKKKGWLRTFHRH
jgi:hypothetical protein